METKNEPKNEQKHTNEEAPKQASKLASEEELEKLRQEGLKILRRPEIREIFMRLKDK